MLLVWTLEYLPNITILMYMNRKWQLDEFTPFYCLKSFHIQLKRTCIPMVWYSTVVRAGRFSSWLAISFLQ
jgi:hypothetical protein